MADQKDLAYKDYLKGMKYKEIAEKYGVTINTVKSWKTRYKWSRNGVHTNGKSVHTKKEQRKTKKDKINIIKKPVIENDELTDKQRLFCLYYLKYFNATKAYQKAYECSYLTARVEGHRNLAKPNIKKEIERIKQEQQRELMLDAQSVLQKYIDIAFADITDYVSFGQREEQVIGMYGPVFEGKGDDKKAVMQKVNYIDLKESIEIDGTIVTEVKQGRDGITVKLADKMKALEMLSKYFDLFPDKFKRKVEEEKLKLAKLKVDNDEQEDLEDDGFLDALESKISEVWDDDEED